MPTEDFSIRVDGLRELEGVPAELEQRQERFVNELVDDLASRIRSRIRSRSGRLASSWRGRGVTSTLGIVETDGTRYGKASVRGAFIKPRKGRVLAFRDRSGQLVFRRWVRLSPGNYMGHGNLLLGNDPENRKQSYVTQALSDRRRIAQEAFARTFGKGSPA